jgi:ATP-dependent RNA helicase CshB
LPEGMTNKTKKPKKVKPGYKKKAKREMEQKATRQRRLNKRKG